MSNLEKKERMIKILGVMLFFIVLLSLPSLAKFSVAEEDQAENFVASFVWIMFPSWVYLGGAVIMLLLGIKYMNGGALARPFTLMGFALLLDALVQMVSSLIFLNLIPPIEMFGQVVFGVGLLFRLSVVFGMVWIGNIFGVLRSPSTPADSANSSAGSQ